LQTQTQAEARHKSKSMFVLFGYELKTTQNACIDFFKQGVEEDISLIALDTGLAIWIEKTKDDLHPVFLQATDDSAKLYETLALWFGTYLEALGSIDLGSPSYLNMLVLE
jgi:hypothetical protein